VRAVPAAQETASSTLKASKVTCRSSSPTHKWPTSGSQMTMLSETTTTQQRAPGTPMSLLYQPPTHARAEGDLNVHELDLQVHTGFTQCPLE
jgi:hypothetical protein